MPTPPRRDGRTSRDTNQQPGRPGGAQLPNGFRCAPQHLDALAERIVAVIPELTEELSHRPCPTDIAGRLQADVDDVIEVLTTDGRPYRRRSAPARNA